MGDVFNTIVTRTKLKTIRVLMVKCKHIPGFEFSGFLASVDTLG
jgi:hypothetical protein